MLEEEDVFLREGSNGKSSFLWIYIELFIHRIFSCPPPDAVSPNLVYILGSWRPFWSLAFTRTSLLWTWRERLVLSFGDWAKPFSSVQSLSHVWLFATPWIAARQASLSITDSQSPPKLTSIESVVPSSHVILCRPLFLLPPIPPSIRVFSNESTLYTTICCSGFVFPHHAAFGILAPWPGTKPASHALEAQFKSLDHRGWLLLCLPWRINSPACGHPGVLLSLSLMNSVESPSPNSASPWNCLSDPCHLGLVKWELRLLELLWLSLSHVPPPLKIQKLVHTGSYFHWIYQTTAESLVFSLAPLFYTAMLEHPWQREFKKNFIRR